MATDADDTSLGETPPLSPSPIAHRGDDGHLGDESAASARMFQYLAGFFAVLTLVYAVTADDAGGVALLAFLIFLSLLLGTFLDHARKRGLRQELDVEDYHADDEFWLPTTSLHPVVMGGGITLISAGLAFGIWVFLPGVLLFLFGLYGFVQEGRVRR